MAKGMVSMGEFLSRAGLFDGAWRCYKCKCDIAEEEHHPGCENAAWFEKAEADYRAAHPEWQPPSQPKRRPT